MPQHPLRIGADGKPYPASLSVMRPHANQVRREVNDRGNVRFEVVGHCSHSRAIRCHPFPMIVSQLNCQVARCGIERLHHRVRLMRCDCQGSHGQDFDKKGANELVSPECIEGEFGEEAACLGKIRQ